MCDKETTTGRPYYGDTASEVKSARLNQLSTESHLVYELKQKRDYLLRQIVVVQQAIDAVNLTNGI